MRKNFLGLLVAGIAGIAMVGCSGGDSADVTPNKAATEGGNVINDPELKAKLTGAADAGGAGGGAAATQSGIEVPK